MGVGFLCNVVREIGNAAWMERCTTPRKSGYGKIEATPEEVHRADLAAKFGSKLLEYAVDRNQRTVEAVDGIRIVGAQDCVFGEWYWIGQLTPSCNKSKP